MQIYFMASNKKSLHISVKALFPCTRGRDRTGTNITAHRILSPACLPIPPLGHLKTLSEKRDSDPRPQPWQGCALPLSYSRII